MFFNAELRRNIWVDFSLHRLLLAPITIGLMTYLFYIVSGKISSASIAFYIACFFIFLWGTKKASEAVIDEVNNNTWDFQRQSTLSPWSMTWGKLLGSTLYSWYGALICLFIYILLSPQLSLTQELLLLLMGGLFSQAMALLFSMQALNVNPRQRTHKSFRYFLSAAVIGTLLTRCCLTAVKQQGTLLWHDYPFAIGPFAIISLLILLGWALLGLQRSFCKELQYQTLPWAWTGFNLFCVVYFSGFISPNQFSFDASTFAPLNTISQLLSNASYYIGFFVAQTLTYFALFTDIATTVRYKKLLIRFQEGSFKESLQQLPWWVISFGFTVVTGIIALYQTPVLQTLDNFSPLIFILTTTLFLIRDIILVHYFNFSKNPTRAMSTAVLYLFLLYLILPLLLEALHLGNLLPLLIPSWGQNTGLAIFSCGGQIMLLGALCGHRWLTAKRIVET